MKLYATDYDGTFSYGGITDEKREAVKKWREKGNLFGIVTGRPDESMVETLTKERIEVDFVISDNGAIIKDKDGKLIFSKPIKSSAVIDLLKKAKEYDSFVTRFSNEDGYFMVRGVPDATENPENNSVVLGRTEIKDVVEIAIRVKTHEENVKLCSAAGIVTGNIIHGLSSSPISTDYVSSDITKSNGIKNYIRAYGLHPEKIYTTGDQLNDIDMLTDPEFEGYAVENAAEEVKKAVGRTVKSPLNILSEEI